MLDLSGVVNINCVWVVFLITSHRRAQAISCSSLVFLSFDELCDLFHDVGLAILLRSYSVVWLTYWKKLDTISIYLSVREAVSCSYLR